MFAKCLQTYFELYYDRHKNKARRNPTSLAFTYGGSMWESNPPKKLLTPHASFED